MNYQAIEVKREGGLAWLSPIGLRCTKECLQHSIEASSLEQTKRAPSYTDS